MLSLDMLKYHLGPGAPWTSLKEAMLCLATVRQPLRNCSRQCMAQIKFAYTCTLVLCTIMHDMMWAG